MKNVDGLHELENIGIADIIDIAHKISISLQMLQFLIHSTLASLLIHTRGSAAAENTAR